MIIIIVLIIIDDYYYYILLSLMMMTMMMADADAGSGLSQVVWEIERKLCASCPWAQDILTMVTATAQGVDTSSAGGNSSTARLQVRKLECAIVQYSGIMGAEERERERVESFIPTWVSGDLRVSLS